MVQPSEYAVRRSTATWLGNADVNPGSRVVCSHDQAHDSRVSENAHEELERWSASRARVKLDFVANLSLPKIDSTLCFRESMCDELGPCFWPPRYLGPGDELFNPLPRPQLGWAKPKVVSDFTRT
jgi:hypothetical protein